ncbi:uncharacterized protein V1518DRAFT_182258 [Limtongia smithiae]|uniref:uncharacterized protein n=1 Tax=Limtongia smithiae TaxID=1125753 RepID=UPI0034CFA304
MAPRVLLRAAALCSLSRDALLPPPRDASTAPARATQQDWADGARGLACLFVYLYHIGSAATATAGYWVRKATDGAGIAPSFLQIFPVRLVWAGPAAVFFFFTLSGYALSLRTMSLIHSGAAPERAYSSVASAAIRRYPRLFVPVAVSIAFIYVLTLLHAFPYAAEYGFKHVPPLTSFTHFLVMVPRVFAFHDVSYEYNDSLWTMPHEISGSFKVFLLQLVLVPIRLPFHVPMLVMFIAYGLLLEQNIYYINFAAGVLVAVLYVRRTQSEPARMQDFESADLELEKEEVALSRIFLRSITGLKIMRAIWSTLVAWHYNLCIIFGLYLASFPVDAPSAINVRLYHWLSASGWGGHLVHHHWKHGKYKEDILTVVWNSLGSMLILYGLALTRTKCLHIFLSIRPFKFLGDISFALYIYHYPIFISLGGILAHAFQGALNISAQAAIFIASFFVLLVLFVWSWFVTRTVDSWAIKLAKQIDMFVRSS